MDYPLIEGSGSAGAYDGDVLEAERVYGEGHDGAGGQVVVSWTVCSP